MSSCAAVTSKLNMFTHKAVCGGACGEEVVAAAVAAVAAVVFGTFDIGADAVTVTSLWPSL